MKLPAFYEPPAHEVEVEVGLEDVTALLKAEPNTRAAAIQLANDCATALKGIPPEIIHLLTGPQRKLIADFFHLQADRFHTQSGWIPVEAARPPTDEPVVYARQKIDGKWSVGIAYWTVSEKWNPEEQSKHAPTGFTYWKPLGELPE